MLGWFKSNHVSKSGSRSFKLLLSCKMVVAAGNVPAHHSINDFALMWNKKKWEVMVSFDVKLSTLLMFRLIASFSAIRPQLHWSLYLPHKSFVRQQSTRDVAMDTGSLHYYVFTPFCVFYYHGDWQYHRYTAWSLIVRKNKCNVQRCQINPLTIVFLNLNEAISLAGFYWYFMMGDIRKNIGQLVRLCQPPCQLTRLTFTSKRSLFEHFISSTHSKRH